MTAVLVTGATGFLGRAVCTALTTAGYELVATSRSGGAGTCALELPADNDRLADLLEQRRAETIVHLAAAGVSSSRRDLVSLVDANVTGTATILDCARSAGVGRVINVSTVLAEEPRDAYGATKAAAELLVSHSRHVDPPLDACTVRLPVLVGPGDHPHKLVPSLVRHAVAGTAIGLRTPERVRAYLHVDDAARALVHICGQDEVNERYDVPGERSLTLRDLDRLARGLAEGDPPPPGLPRTAPVGGLPGWSPTVTLEAALEELIAGERAERRA